MMKSEQFRSADRLQKLVSSTQTVSGPSQSYMFPNKTQATARRSIDPHAIDISSIKGRFAWEKITFGDTYMPVIFRYVDSVFYSFAHS